MTIQTIKDQVECNLGKTISIKYNGARNKTQIYQAVIKEMYNFIFMVELIDNKEKKSFSYVDVLTKTIEISY